MKAADLDYASIPEGSEHVRRYTITAAVYEAFLGAFEDRSPIHVDETYARDRGFEGKVMHGAILNGFVSHFVGMCFPGARSLLLSVDLRYATPCYLGDVVELRATVSQKVNAHQVVVLTLRIENVTRGTAAANGRAQVSVSDA